MKTTFRFFATAAIAVLAFVSCDKENLSQNEGAASSEGRVITLSFKTDFTRTELGADGYSPKFTGVNEIIRVSDGNSFEDCDVTVNDGVASITISKEELKAASLTAVYPASAAKMNGNEIVGILVSTEQDGTFASANICQATIEAGSTGAVFENKTAVFKITPNSEHTISYIEVITAGPEIANSASGSYTSMHKIHVATTSTDPVYVSILVPNGLKVRDLSFADGGYMKTVNDNTTAISVGTLNTVSGAGWSEPYVEVDGMKWATRNVGAETSTEAGTYFAWGDVVGQTWNGSSWSSGGFSTKPDIGNPSVLPLDKDAANVNWGGSWRMPTKDEFGTFINGCSYTDGNFTHNGVTFPAAGCSNSTVLNDAGDVGYYWSSTRSTDTPNSAFFFHFGGGYAGMADYNRRNFGQSVRPLSE